MMEKAAFIDIKELETHSPKEQVQIKKNIIRSNDLYSIPTIYLPDIITNEYYFVSYSHKDYADVYCDIFDLQMEGLPIWYDRGIPVGKNWKEVATRFIAPYACKGTLFYVSENSLTSDAVMEEIKSVKGYNKPFMAILISKEKESLRELIERIYKENKISEKKYKFLLNIFKDEIIYLDIGTPTSTKVEKIKNSLPDQPKLYSAIKWVEDYDESSFKDGKATANVYYLNINGINDAFIEKVDIKDYLDLLDDNLNTMGALAKLKRRHEGEKVIGITRYQKNINKIKELTVHYDVAAMANMSNLKSVDIPFIFEFGSKAQNNFVSTTVSDYVFYNCIHLEKVRIVVNKNTDKKAIYLGVGAFERCYKLSAFDFDGVGIDKSTFRNSGLKQVDLSNIITNYVPESCFESCRSLKKVILGNHITSIGEEAFSGCHKLKEIVIPEGLEEIGQEAFRETKLASIYLPVSLKKIDKWAFMLCGKLTSITYNGTKDKFLSIVDKEFIGPLHKKVEIICSDETFKL